MSINVNRNDPSIQLWSPGADLSLAIGTWWLADRRGGDASGGQATITVTPPATGGYSVEGFDVSNDAGATKGEVIWIPSFPDRSGLTIRLARLFTLGGIGTLQIVANQMIDWPWNFLVDFPGIGSQITPTITLACDNPGAGNTLFGVVWGFIWDVRARQLGPRKLTGINVPHPLARLGL